MYLVLIHICDVFADVVSWWLQVKNASWSAENHIAALACLGVYHEFVMFLLISRCLEVFATCPGDNTDPTQAKTYAGEVVKTQQVAKTTETTHTHNASCHRSYQKWMELCRTATRNRETNFVAFVNTNFCANSYGWFRAGSDLATGFILGLQLLGTPETERQTETNCARKALTNCPEALHQRKSSSLRVICSMLRMTGWKS